MNDINIHCIVNMMIYNASYVEMMHATYNKTNDETWYETYIASPDTTTRTDMENATRKFIESL